MAKDKKKNIRLYSTCDASKNSASSDYKSCRGYYYTTMKSGKNKPKIEKKKFCRIHNCHILFKESSK